MAGGSWLAVLALLALQAPYLAQGFNVHEGVLGGKKTFPDVLGRWEVGQALIPTTTSTKAQVYVTQCNGIITYSLDAGSTVTLGTYVLADMPYVSSEGLDDGTHTLTFTCAAGAAVTYTWMVDTSDSLSIRFTQTTLDVTNTAVNMLYLAASEPIGANVDTVNWYASEVLEGAATNFGTAIATCANSQTCTYSTTMGIDGKYTYKFKAVYQYKTVAAVSYPTDLGVRTSSVKGTSVTMDTTAPTIQITSSPAARSAYTPGKIVSFEFGCAEGSCTFDCSFDGKNSATARDSTAVRGFFACTSPVTLTVNSSTTHSFVLKAKDAAGNSATSSRYVFYADGTAPTIAWDTATHPRVLEVAAAEGVIPTIATLPLTATSATEGKVFYKCIHTEMSV